MAGLPLPDPPLTDGVVALRPWRESDVPAIVAAYLDSEIARFSWPATEPYTEADARAYVQAQDASRTAGVALELAIVAAGAGESAPRGVVSLYDVEADQARARTGYWLAPDVRGRGWATRAVRLLAGWAFAELALERIELTCDPENAPSRRVAGRCGFKPEGVLRSHMRFKDGRRDTMVFGLLRTELR
jgi:RimJ/RimL family protein N-acetyltransferase